MVIQELAPKQTQPAITGETQQLFSLRERVQIRLARTPTLFVNKAHDIGDTIYSKKTIWIAGTVGTVLITGCTAASTQQSMSASPETSSSASHFPTTVPSTQTHQKAPAPKSEHSLGVPSPGRSAGIEPTSQPTQACTETNGEQKYKFIPTHGGLITYISCSPAQVIEDPASFVSTPTDEYVGITVPGGLSITVPGGLSIDPREVTGVKVQAENSQENVDQGDFGLINLGNIKSVPTFLLVYFPRVTPANKNLLKAVEDESKSQDLVGTLAPMVNERVWKKIFIDLGIYGDINLIRSVLYVAASTAGSS